MTNPEPTLGEIAYNGYYEKTGGKTWNGYPMPLWADLHVNVKYAWEAGAEAVRAHITTERLAAELEIERLVRP